MKRYFAFVNKILIVKALLLVKAIRIQGRIESLTVLRTEIIFKDGRVQHLHL